MKMYMCIDFSTISVIKYGKIYFVLQEQRRRLNSTIKIQAYVRSYLTRSHFKQYQRELYDSLFPSNDVHDHVVLSSLIAKLLFFYDGNKDFNRLVNIYKNSFN